MVAIKNAVFIYLILSFLALPASADSTPSTDVTSECVEGVLLYDVDWGLNFWSLSDKLKKGEHVYVRRTPVNGWYLGCGDTNVKYGQETVRLPPAPKQTPVRTAGSTVTECPYPPADWKVGCPLGAIGKVCLKTNSNGIKAGTWTAWLMEERVEKYLIQQGNSQVEILTSLVGRSVIDPSCNPKPTPTPTAIPLAFSRPTSIPISTPIIATATKVSSKPNSIWTWFGALLMVVALIGLTIIVVLEVRGNSQGKLDRLIQEAQVEFDRNTALLKESLENGHQEAAVIYNGLVRQWQGRLQKLLESKTRAVRAETTQQLARMADKSAETLFNVSLE